MNTVHSTRAVNRSRLHDLLAPDAFLWATGIEDTFVFDPHIRTNRILDEYELTGHYERLEEDLERVASLGVGAVRYGLPWYKIQPEPDRWDWDFADRALGKLLDLGVDPIVDLIHYGTPAWMDKSFLNPDYPQAVARFAAEIASRFKGRIHWYTPLNEPRITAWYCGRLGQWPPYERSWRGFVKVLLACAKGIVLTDRALEKVDPEIVKCHVDASDLYETEDPDCQDEAAFRQALVFLCLDLITGNVDSEHELYRWLLREGATENELRWFRDHPTRPDILGINLYPMFTYKRLTRKNNRTRYQKIYASGTRLVEVLGRQYGSRYGVPMFISETASVGSVPYRAKWMRDSIDACRILREEGIPMVGYTWWPMFSLVAWPYRASEQPIGKYLIPMGLWDLDEQLNRQPTALVDQYRQYAQGRPPGQLSQRRQ